MTELLTLPSLAGYDSSRYNLYWTIRCIDDSSKAKLVELDIKDISEVELTGKYSPQWAGCPQVIIRFRNGSTRKTNLYLTGESHGGSCYPEYGIGRELDSVEFTTDFGWIEVPLRYVKKIVFP